MADSTEQQDPTAVPSSAADAPGPEGSEGPRHPRGRRRAMRVVLIVLGVLFLLVAVAVGGYLATERNLAGQAEAEPEKPSVAERLEAAALDVFADRGLERSRPIIEARERLGTDEDDETWHAQGFPRAGVNASLHSAQASTDAAMATVNLYELSIPRGAEPCEVPWDDHVLGERPCDVVDEGSDQQIVIVGYTNLREIYLIDEDWVLNLNVNGTTGDGELSDGPVPLTVKEQRSALLTIAADMRLR